MNDLLASYPVVIEQPVAWGDMDAFHHVNNVVYFRYFENARVEYIRRLGWWEMMDQSGIGPIVAATQARYRRPVTYPDTLRCGAKLLTLGKDRLTLKHTIVSTKTGELVTDGDAVVVVFDYRNNTKIEFPPLLLERLRELEGTLPE
jgi:acyl-CoA thioester hydrolase